MGSGRWTTADWARYSSAHVAGKSTSAAFAVRELLDEFDPAKIEVRESRDSADNPSATPIILASDVTGSMGHIAHELLKTGLNKVMTGIYDRRPVPDPHIMVMAVGDAYCDQAPLQVTQFEADIRIAEQVQRLWLEGGGGGNMGESYSAAHMFAAMKTSTDALEKRGRKGYLFTIGDEPVLDGMTAEQIRTFLGIPAERDLPAADILELAQRKYEVFHVVITGGYAGRDLPGVLATWKPLLPERTLILDDHTRLAEVIISTIQVNEGSRVDEVVKSWDPGTALVISKVIAGLPTAATARTGIQRLA